MIKSTLVAAAMLVAGIAGTASMAEAKGGHGGHGGGHFGGHFHRGYSFAYVAPVYGYSGYSSCGYAYSRWMESGSFYWKKRYYACKGWY